MSTACSRGGVGSAGSDDSSAWLFSPYRTHIGADICTGIRALSVGLTSVVDTLDFQPRLAARTSLAEPFAAVWAAIGRSSYWPPRVISAKTMLATLANATAVSLNLYFTVLHSSILFAHRRMTKMGDRYLRKAS
jgi:hypothetical protein